MRGWVARVGNAKHEGPCHRAARARRSLLVVVGQNARVDMSSPDVAFEIERRFNANVPSV